MSTSVLFSTFPPLPTLSLRVPSETCVNNLYDLLCDRYPDLPASDSLYISSYNRSLKPDTRLSELHGDSSDLVSLRIIPRLRGGKGGFGSQLRAAGGRMSSQKTSNNDSCRDLSGRRLSTIKTAKRFRAIPSLQQGKNIVLTIPNTWKKVRKLSIAYGPLFLQVGALYRANADSMNEHLAGLLKKKKKVKVNHTSSSAEGSNASSEQRKDLPPAVPSPVGGKVVTSPETAPVTVIASA
ncbi:telomere stability and silencing-domain-containing protein [Boletus reticuloceps]|uniref:Telomere stability and silencing-domain-containing protein n=1 Tax=Boletus reticuloceps TaxID=495285 RepID=A0A8I2YJ72_9AGAM|nr:telomere stability and silencing-domain-containing protein [Boletus reticuloceps]